MLLKQVEAVLFAVGKKIHVDEIAKLCRTRKKDQVLEALKQLKEKYDNSDSAVKLFQEGDIWKLSVSDEFIPTIQNIVTDTELSKSVMETLAVIAWKYPILQADLIKIRTNKAYDHLVELEEGGFVKRNKFGRTRQITLTDKFFTYFDLPNNKDSKGAFEKLLPQEVKDKLEKAHSEIEAGEKLIEEALQKKMLEQQKEAGNTALVPVQEASVALVGQNQSVVLQEYGKSEEKDEPLAMEVYDENEGVEIVDEPEIPEEKEESAEEKLKKKKKDKKDEKSKETSEATQETTEQTDEDSPEVEAEMEKMLNPEKQDN